MLTQPDPRFLTQSATLTVLVHARLLPPSQSVRPPGLPRMARTPSEHCSPTSVISAWDPVRFHAEGCWPLFVSSVFPPLCRAPSPVACCHCVAGLLYLTPPPPRPLSFPPPGPSATRSSLVGQFSGLPSRPFFLSPTPVLNLDPAARNRPPAACCHWSPRALSPATTSLCLVSSPFPFHCRRTKTKRRPHIPPILGSPSLLTATAICFPSPGEDGPLHHVAASYSPVHHVLVLAGLY